MLAPLSPPAASTPALPPLLLRRSELLSFLAEHGTEPAPGSPRSPASGCSNSPTRFRTKAQQAYVTHRAAGSRPAALQLRQPGDSSPRSPTAAAPRSPGLRAADSQGCAAASVAQLLPSPAGVLFPPLPSGKGGPPRRPSASCQDSVQQQYEAAAADLRPAAVGWGAVRTVLGDDKRAQPDPAEETRSRMEQLGLAPKVLPRVDGYGEVVAHAREQAHEAALKNRAQRQRFDLLPLALTAAGEDDGLVSPTARRRVRALLSDIKRAHWRRPQLQERAALAASMLNIKQQRVLAPEERRVRVHPPRLPHALPLPPISPAHAAPPPTAVMVVVAGADSDTSGGAATPPVAPRPAGHPPPAPAPELVLPRYVPVSAGPFLRAFGLPQPVRSHSSLQQQQLVASVAPALPSDRPPRPADAIIAVAAEVAYPASAVAAATVTAVLQLLHWEAVLDAAVATPLPDGTPPQGRGRGRVRWQAPRAARQPRQKAGQKPPGRGPPSPPEISTPCRGVSPWASSTCGGRAHHQSGRPRRLLDHNAFIPAGNPGGIPVGALRLQPL
eukprot:TRINITY_DN20123_c1_g1_i1.p1 TRINITY_DN20123_c1_g1~~TRINITY_DN20123_c1_g1_i1.p1  ORF type:complete len:581 (+),score=40.01 TRINITY_DN20123_c1_g1_i1:79-1743(+)